MAERRGKPRSRAGGSETRGDTGPAPTRSGEEDRSVADPLGIEYRASLDALFDAVHVVDTDLRIVLINESFKRWLEQFDLGTDVVGRRVFEVFPFLPEHVTEEYERVFEQGEPLVTRESVTVGERVVHTETRKFPVSAAGRVVRVVTVVRDITELELATAAVRQSEENYRRLVELAPIGIAVHQGDRIVFANRAALDIVGASSPGEVLGRPVLDFVHPEYLEHVRARVNALGPNEPMPPVGEKFVRVDGTPIDVYVTGAVFTFRGRPAIQVLFQDISERLAAEQRQQRLNAQVERAHRLEGLGALAGGIAHDFNNLLTAILGRVELARVQSHDVKLTGMLREAERAGEQAVALTRQLLTFAKGGTPVREATRLGALAKETAEFCVRGRPVHLSLALGDQRLAHIDAGQIRQVVQNLVLNAIEAMPEGGTLTISTADTTVDGRPYVELRASDTGHGMADDLREHVFEPYFTTKPAGSGLGLTVVHSIVTQHGGRVRVHSAPGKGTTVTVELPCAHTRPSAPAARPSLTPAKPLEVLVMDDDPGIRAVVADMLTGAGHRAVCTTSGEKAIEAYRAALADGRRFDAVVLDLTVRRGMGGKEAAAAIVAVDPSATLVVSSGYSDDPVLANAAEYGFSAILPKPFALPQLLDALASAVRKRRAIDAAALLPPDDSPSGPGR